MCCGKQHFLILKPYRRWSPMIADAPMNLVFINRNSSAMDRRLSAMNYDLMKTRLYEKKSLMRSRVLAASMDLFCFYRGRLLPER